MAETLSALIKSCSDWLWGWPMVIILLGTHLFLTVRLRFPQRKLFKAIRLSVQSDKSGQGDVSQFGALATALAATIGTGNIVGVATAITLGGPGAVFWCWLTGVLGISTKYAEGLLAVKYRIRTPQGKMLGGPMYALERGMGMKWLAVLFCIFTVCASFGIGNLVQSNAISMLCYETYRVPQALTGTAVAVCVALVVIFGVKGIARVCSAFVPLMAALYFLGWCYYGEKAMEYLSGKRWTLVYRGVFIVGVFFGAITQLAVVWNFADLTNALMALPNIVSLIGLSGIAAAETRKYLWEDRLDEEADPEDNPM